MKPRDEIWRWYCERIAAFPPAKKGAVQAVSDDFTAADWEAFYTLHKRFRIDERTPQEKSDLELAEQRILRKSPPVEQRDSEGHGTGVFYPAPWTWGVRVAAARKLWGHEPQSAGATVSPVEAPLEDVHEKPRYSGSKGWNAPHWGAGDEP